MDNVLAAPAETTSAIRSSRRLTGWWRLGQWLGCCLAMPALLLIGLRGLKGWQALSDLTGPWHWAGEIAVRVVLALPCLGLLLLIAHPRRARRWMLIPVGALLRRANTLSRRVPGAEHPVAALESLADLIEPEAAPHPISRRRFLGEAALFGGALAYSSLIEPYWYDVIEVDLPVAQLPPRFAGMRIAQLSDLHVNAYTTAEDVERAVDAINGLAPDLVLMTGDFVDRDSKYADDAVVPLSRLRATEGVYSVLGNHDYYTGDIDRVRWAIERQDLGLLVNRHTILRRGGDTLALVGLDDPKHDHNGDGWSRASIDPARALRGIPSATPRIVMLHNPVLAPQIVRDHGPAAILCGHTHGGQFRVPILTDAAVRYRDHFVRGRYEMGKTQIYVNRGWGFTGPPLRFRVRPEITVFRLVAA